MTASSATDENAASKQELERASLVLWEGPQQEENDNGSSSSAPAKRFPVMMGMTLMLLRRPYRLDR